MTVSNLETQIEKLEAEQETAAKNGDIKTYQELEKKIDRILDILDRAEKEIDEPEQPESIPESVATIVDNPATSVIEAVESVTGGNDEKQINWL